MAASTFTAELSTFKQAIANIESAGGNYNALGPVLSGGNRARGKYQIMSQYWDAWAREAGIPGADWRDPKAQERVASYKFSQYYKAYGGRWDAVAVAWFAGPGRAKKYLDNPQSVVGISDVLGTSVGRYVQRVARYMETNGHPVHSTTRLPGEWVNPDAVMEQQEQHVPTLRDASKTIASGLARLFGSSTEIGSSITGEEPALAKVGQFIERESETPEPVAPQVKQQVGFFGPDKQFEE